MDDRHQKISERAHQIWESEGRPEGRHEDHWQRAEREADQGSEGEVAENWKIEAGETDNEHAPAWPTAIAPD